MARLPALVVVSLRDLVLVLLLQATNHVNFRNANTLSMQTAAVFSEHVPFCPCFATSDLDRHHAFTKQALHNIIIANEIIANLSFMWYDELI